VVGVMVQLGSFARLPGNAQRADAAADADRTFAVLIDSRPANLGQVLQHPLIRLPSDAAAAADSDSPRWKRIDSSRSPQHRVRDLAWTELSRYQDPLAGFDGHYNQRWLAAKLPVQVGGRDAGLSVIVQESYGQAIGQPLAELRRGLILLSLITFGLSAAVIVPLWIVILRLVR
jgi:hypothetical protein